MFDPHIHLQYCRDLEPFLASRGGDTFYTQSVKPEEWPRIATLAWNNTSQGKKPDSENRTRIIPFFGIHPWETGGISESDLNALSVLCIKRDEIFGIGETGLDKLRGPDMVCQEQSLRYHLSLAAELQVPVSLHCVRAWGHMLSILKDYAPLPRGSHIHAFAGSRESAEQLITMGVLVSFSPLGLNEKSQRIQRVFRELPAVSIILDTDFPYAMHQSMDEYEQVYNTFYDYASGIRGMNRIEFEEIIRNNGTVL